MRHPCPRLFGGLIFCLLLQASPSLQDSRILITAHAGLVGLWIDSTAWRPDDARALADAREFAHANGTLFARVLVGTTPLTLDQVAEIGVANARQAAATAAAQHVLRHQVGGVPVVAMDIDLAAHGKSYLLSGYYYGGPGGSVQLTVFGERTDVEANRSIVLALLNGLVITDAGAKP